MRERLLAFLGTESGEESMVSMLLVQSVFLGVFIGAFDIAAYSLFLSVFDEKMMARGFVISGIVGLFFLSIYSFLKKRIKFRNFTQLNLIFITILTLTLWSALTLSSSDSVIFILFVMFGPLNLLVLKGFWDSTEQTSTIKQGKRLFRLADSGLTVGILAISLVIAVLMALKFQSRNILLISAISVSIAALLQVVIVKGFNSVTTHNVDVTRRNEAGRSLFILLLKDPYIRIIVSFTALSVLAAFVIQYSFMAVTRLQYPVAEDMAGFLGLFTGIMMTFILFLKQVVFANALQNYGMRTCILISPLMITVVIAASISLGVLMGFSSPTTIRFVLFFFLMAIARFVSKSLRDSFEFRAVKIICQTINEQSKFHLHLEISGRLNEIMVIISGLILTGLGLFSFIRLIHFSVLLLIISILWIIVAFRLYKEYRKSIFIVTEKEELTVNGADNQAHASIFKSRFSAYLTFRTDYFNLISGNFSVLNESTNIWYFEKIVDYAESKKDINLLPSLRKIAVNPGLNESIRSRSSVVVEKLQKPSISKKNSNVLISDAIISLSGTRLPQTTEILRLLHDNSVESKRLAIYMIGKFRLSDLLSEACECLNMPGLTTDAYEIIKTFGRDAVDDLISYYLKTSGNQRLSKIILRLLGNICSEETSGFLFSRLWSNSRQLKEIAVKSLVNCKFKPGEEEKQRLDQMASEVIGSITWNLSAKISFEKDNNIFLLKRIDLEINRWNEFLFNILSITYNSGSIAIIREHIRKGTVDSVSYALEIADMLFSERIKKQLIYLLDVVPDEEKLRNLFQFYPGGIQGSQRLLEDIINCDYNLISLLTKACVLRSISRIEGTDMAESVTALLFSPEEIIQEESASLIARSNKEFFHSALERIPDQVRKHVINIMNETADRRELLIEKVQFLSKYFKAIPEDELLSLAREMKFTNNFDMSYPRNSGGCIIWFLNVDNEASEVHVFYGEEEEYTKRKIGNGERFIFYYLPLSAVEEYHFQFPDKSFNILKYIDFIELN
jgi:ATP:ADP antiporter, AAA family